MYGCKSKAIMNMKKNMGGHVYFCHCLFINIPFLTNCKPGYRKLQPGSDSCFKLSGDISGYTSGGKAFASVSTAAKVCATEGTSLWTPQVSGDIFSLVL